MIKNTLTSFYGFLRLPKDEMSPNQAFSFKMKSFSILFIFEIFVMMLLMAMIGLLEKAELLDMGQHEMGAMMERLPIPVLLLGGVVVIPLLEELIFRYFLVYRRNIPFLILESLGNPEKVQSFWHRNYRLFFYSSTVAFAYAHIFNFGALTTQILLLSPLLVAPQFFMGAVAGYLRVKFGFTWSYALHFFHNLLFVGAAVMAMNMAVEKMNESNKDYDIKIEEIAVSNNPDRFIEDITTDSSITYNIKNHPTKALFALLTGMDSDRIDVDDKKINSLKYNIFFLAKTDGIDIKSTILNEFHDTYQTVSSREMRPSSNWNLVVLDSTLLMKHSIHKDSVGLPSSSGTLFAAKDSFKNYKIRQLSIHLNSSYSENISTAIKMDEQFNFDNIPLINFDKTNSHLKKEYGLGLIRDNEQVEYLIIRKKE